MKTITVKETIKRRSDTRDVASNLYSCALAVIHLFIKDQSADCCSHDRCFLTPSGLSFSRCTTKPIQTVSWQCYAFYCFISVWCSRDLTELTSYSWRLALLALGRFRSAGLFVRSPFPSCVMLEGTSVQRRLDVHVRVSCTSAYCILIHLLHRVQLRHPSLHSLMTSCLVPWNPAGSPVPWYCATL